MPVRKASIDEVLSKRKEGIVSTGRGDALVKAVKAPASWDAENRTAKFVMTTESVDRYGDILVQSGGQIDRFMQNPQALLFHNSRSWPIGYWSDVTKILTGRPKRTEGVLNFIEEGADEDADRAARHVAAKTIRTVSIGFIPLEAEWITDDDDHFTGLRFLAWEMIEASLVPIPANPDCVVKDAGGDMALARELIEDILDTYAKTPEGLLVPRAEYEKAYRTVVEKIAEDRSAVVQKILEKAVADAVSKDAGAEADVAVDVGDKKAASKDTSDKEDDDGGVLVISPASTTDIVVKIDADTAPLEQAVTKMEGVLETFRKKLNKIFGRDPSDERIEPTVEVPAVEPSPEVIAEAKSRAAALIERSAKHLT